MLKNRKFIIITGVIGGIGSELAKILKQNDYIIIGIDIKTNYRSEYIDYYFNIDIEKFAIDEQYLNVFYENVEKIIKKSNLTCIINNAAIQIVKKVELITIDDFQRTLRINTLAPFFLIQKFLQKLENSFGSVINISSIHANLTKKNFTAYATSKSALSGLTKALSVELGHRIRVNAIAPAAISTKMLVSGFKNNPTAFKKLSKLHPVGRIGKPIEVAKLALFLISEDAKFINGAILNLDGGISNCLYDPQ